MSSSRPAKNLTKSALAMRRHAGSFSDAQELLSRISPLATPMTQNEVPAPARRRPLGPADPLMHHVIIRQTPGHAGN